MDPDESICTETWGKSSSGCEPLNTHPIFTNFDSSLFNDYGIRIEQQFSGLNRQFGAESSLAHQSDNTQDWDPKAMLNNLSFLEKKVHQLQDLVHLVIGRREQSSGSLDEILVQQQQLITADLTSIIVQLISTAGSLLPSVRNTLSSEIMNQVTGNVVIHNNKAENQTDQKGILGNDQVFPIEDHDMKSDDDADEGENLPPGSYEILQLEKEEILAPHTHFCTICGKGFKRDANLRMHMRGHGDEYKTPAALAKPHKESTSDPILIKRYSCPYIGCKRNKDHKKFQPLKTILCVKNHYKRTHCDKNYTCSRCNVKKFSVIADLKTHEKHCGRDKWLCSCGTTFSRKDKLFGHITLFQGHTPAIPAEECKGSAVGPFEETNKLEQIEFNQNVMDAEGSSFFSTGFDEFPRPTFDDSESAFSFLLSGSYDFPPKTTRYNGLE